MNFNFQNFFSRPATKFRKAGYKSHHWMCDIVSSFAVELNPREWDSIPTILQFLQAGFLGTGHYGGKC